MISVRALMTIRKRPRESSISGPKNNFKKGLTVKLIRVRTSPRIRIFTQFSERTKFGTTFAAAKRASVFESIRKSALVINPI